MVNNKSDQYKIDFRMKYYTVFLSILCILLSFALNAKTKKSKAITTLLDAKWDVTPLVLETAEYLADENVDFYWSFIDSISNLSPPLEELGKFCIHIIL